MNHESNSLNPIITGEEDFLVFRGEEILEKGMHSNYALTGIINTLREAGAEIIPVLLCRAVPNGVVSAGFYKKIKTEFIERSKKALNDGIIDGICLALHGSMKVESLCGDSHVCAEGDLCSALREIFPTQPITAALDMHGTMTCELLSAVNGFAVYKTAPHIDCAETGSSAAKMLITAITEKKSIRTVCEKIPIMVAGEKSESCAEPMLSLLDACRTAEKEPGILAVSLLLGFPWADDENNAAAVFVSYSCNGETNLHVTAEKIAKELAVSLWDRRFEFRFRTEFYETREALAVAYSYAEQGERPVFLSDSGDNPTAGATGDATDLLEAIIETINRADGLPAPLLYSGFFDAPAVAACLAANEGAELDITLGGNWDTINGKKIPLRVRVKKIFQNYGSFNSDLVLVSHRNLLIALTSKHIGFGDPDLLSVLGVNPKDCSIAVVKLGYLEPCFRDIAAKAILATTKGCSNQVLENIPYKKVRRPIFPLDGFSL